MHRALCLALAAVFALSTSTATTTTQGGLTLTRFNNTALRGQPTAAPAIVSSLISFAGCDRSTCGKPSSLRLTGRLAPPGPGHFGFDLTFDPPLPFPSPEAYARLWVNDHLQHPRDTTGWHSHAEGASESGRSVPLWIPLPPRALDPSGVSMDQPGGGNQTSWELRLEYVCLSPTGCGGRKISLRWATFPPAPEKEFLPKFTAIPSTALVPTQSEPEQRRRSMAAQLQTGWGTTYYPSMWAFVLLPESFVVKVGLYRRSTGAFISADAGITVSKQQLGSPEVNPTMTHAVRAGLHSWNSSYCQSSVMWIGDGGGVNVSLETTVDSSDSSHLTLTAEVVHSAEATVINISDYLLIVYPNFTNGRAGTVSADASGISGISAGLRASHLSLIQGTAARAVVNASQLTSQLGNNGAYLGVSLDKQVVMSTDSHTTPGAVLAKTKAHRAAELATLEKYGEWVDVKDAIQTVLAWSFMYDPKEGLVAPEFPWTYSPSRGGLTGGGFAHSSIDGDTQEGLFCWDGSFASYMLSLDALDWSLSNLIQIVKMRTSAGFIPSLSMGTGKSRDRSNPPVTAKILHEITKRWGKDATRWVVELCFEDLFVWNTWMWTQRREKPLGMLSWGSDPYPYAPDGTKGADTGGGRGAATLESGLDNGPMYDVPFNKTGLFVQDEYDAGYTGMFLMDCQAQIVLAKMIGRDSAASVLQARFDTVNTAMKEHLWSEAEGYYMNRLSDESLTPVQKMAPTSFYPLLVGPADGPSEAQAVTMVQRHLTNNSRFAVWKNATPPTDHIVPPMGAFPLVQYHSCHRDDRDFTCAAVDAATTQPHRLCVSRRCNFNQTGELVGGYIRRFHSKVRFEGMALTAPLATVAVGEAEKENTLAALVAIYEYECPNTANASMGSDFVLGPAGWKPQSPASPCPLWSTEPALYVAATRGSGPGAADMLPLEVWWKPGDHYAVASAAGVADATSSGYKRLDLLGYVHPDPGSANASSRWGLPSISKDDETYTDQDYWHGRIWGPMIQITMWGLEQYASQDVKGAAAGLVEQSKNLLLHNWRGFASDNSPSDGFAGNGRYVFENYGADTGDGFAYSSSAVPMYSWGGLLGMVGLKANGFYEPLAP